MVLMFFRLTGEAYFPRVTGMSRRQGINKCAKIQMQKFDNVNLFPFFLYIVLVSEELRPQLFQY